MTEFRGEVIIIKTIARGRRIINSLSTSKDHAVDFTNDKKNYKGLNDKVNVANIGAYKVSHGVKLGYLSHKYLISPEKSRKTVQNNSHQGIRTILHPSLSQQYITNNQAIRYNRL